MLYKFIINEQNLLRVMTKATILYRIYKSPVGNLKIGSIGEKLCMCDWSDSKRHHQNIQRLKQQLNAELKESSSVTINNAIAQLNEYFSGIRQKFDIPLLLIGTEFQKAIWNQLTNIPYGCTVIYSTIARVCNHPESVRATANAIGANPISIIIPCHRVIGKNGALTGYAGGITAKQALLKLESPQSE